VSPSALAAGGLVLDITGAIVIALGLVLKSPDVARAGGGAGQQRWRRGVHLRAVTMNVRSAAW
jgi:hypothetical protein